MRLGSPCDTSPNQLATDDVNKILLGADFLSRSKIENSAVIGPHNCELAPSVNESHKPVYREL